MKNLIKEEGFKFWILIPLYTLINSIVLFILSNIVIIIATLFVLNLAALIGYYAYNDIKDKLKEWEESK